MNQKAMLVPFSGSEVERPPTEEDADRWISAVFRDLATGDAGNLPVIRDMLPGTRSVFGVNSSWSRRLGVVGLKARGYFPRNAARGESNHQSNVMLMDIASGERRAIVSGNRITALRTAAAAALSVEVGLGEVDAGLWVGLFAPKRTPAAIVEQLDIEVRRTLALPDVKSRFSAVGFETIGRSSKAFNDRITVDATRVLKVIETGVI